jgi:putative component of toxin-antitoxin plasmid stabilization module
MPNAVARIVGRIRRMEMGNPGDTRGVSHGIFEMRIDYGRVTEFTMCIAEHRL